MSRLYLSHRIHGPLLNKQTKHDPPSSLVQRHSRLSSLQLLIPLHHDDTQMSQDIIHAYRHLLRTSLQAIRHAKPARFTLQSHLRSSFRNPTSPFDSRQISQTLEFLNNAAKYKGLEDKIVRNLLQVWGCKNRGVPSSL
jgi:hypothetical protein